MSKQKHNKFRLEHVVVSCSVALPAANQICLIFWTTNSFLVHIWIMSNKTGRYSTGWLDLIFFNRPDKNSNSNNHHRLKLHQCFVLQQKHSIFIYLYDKVFVKYLSYNKNTKVEEISCEIARWNRNAPSETNWNWCLSHVWKNKQINRFFW